MCNNIKKSKSENTTNIPEIDYLPKDFETLERVKDIQKILVKGLENAEIIRPELQTELGVLKKCRRRERCNSGLCPVCQRLLRKKFMRFCYRNRLYKRQWVLMTVRQRRWEMKAGDHTPFAVFNQHSNPSDITDIRELRNLVQNLRRVHKKFGKKEPLLIVASVETTYQIVGKQPATKPFHFHLMISGLSETDVKKASKRLSCKLVPSVSGMARAVDIKDVGQTKHHFIKAMTYPVKQPFWKKSKANSDVKKPDSQTAKPAELAELAHNFGPLECTGRVYFVGIKYHGRKFRLLK